MPLIPYQEFCLETRLSPEEVLARLKERTGPRRWFGWPSASHPLWGEVGANGFELYRVIRYRNSFLPLISGKVLPVKGGSRVEGTMELHPFVAVFVAFWMCACLLFCLITGLHITRDVLFGNLPNCGLFVPFVMILFGWGLTASCFTVEANRSLRLLRETVAAEPKDAQ